MRQDRSTPITETAEEPTGCGPDGYGGFAHHHRSVLDHRRSRLTSAEQAWVRHQVGSRTGRDRDETRKVLRSVCGIPKADARDRAEAGRIFADGGVIHTKAHEREAQIDLPGVAFGIELDQWAADEPAEP